MTAIVTSRVGATRTISVTGAVSDTDAARLRTILVTAIWHERPERIVVEFGSGTALDATAVGALVAAAGIAEDQQLSLGVRCADAALAEQLAAAGIAA